MNNKVFAFFVIVLSIMIICATAWLVISINKYRDITYHKVEKEPVKTETLDSTANNTEQANSSSNNQNSNPVVTEKPKNDSLYILPSDSKELVESDLVGMDYDTLNKAYNEIFARHGHDFNSENLKEYFAKQPWYKKIEGKKVDVSELSSLEAKNLNTIKARIDKIK